METTGFTDLRLIEYFRVSGRLQHFTQAARVLGITQSALSRAMRRLEDDLGVPLFERAGRSIRLTRYGELFLARVERGLAEFEQGRRELHDTDGESGQVSLGFLRTLATSYLPNLIRRFRDQHPSVRFNIQQGRSADLEVQLERGLFDLILSIVPPRSTGLRFTPTDQRKLQLIVPADHPLASRSSVMLQEVANESFVAFKPGDAIRDVADSLCRAAGFLPRIAFEAEESSSVSGFVAARFGVAVVPEREPVSGVATIALDDPLATRAIGISWLDGRYLPQCAVMFRDFVVGEMP